MKITIITHIHAQVNANYDTAKLPRTKTFDGDQKLSEVIDWVKSTRKSSLGFEAVVISEDWEESEQALAATQPETK